MQDILNHLINDIEAFTDRLTAVAPKKDKKKKKKKKGEQNYLTGLDELMNANALLTCFLSSVC